MDTSCKTSLIQVFDEFYQKRVVSHKPIKEVAWSYMSTLTESTESERALCHVVDKAYFMRFFDGFLRNISEEETLEIFKKLTGKVQKDSIGLYSKIFSRM